MVAGASRFGCNPKVSLLAALARVAKHEYLLVSDSNVRARPGYLRAIASEFGDPRVGLVGNVLAGVGERSLGAVFENLHLNSFVAAAVCGARVVAGHACVVGKSMLFRAGDLERLGGFPSVRDVLAEDYVLGREFGRAGFRVVHSSLVLPVVNERRTVSEFVHRHLRWAQMRFRVSPLAYLAEAFLNPIPPFLALLGLGLAGGPAGPLTGRLTWIGVAGIALKLVADSLVGWRLRGSWYRPTELLWVPVKDVIVAVLWIAAMFRRRVDWRGNAFHIGWGSRLFPIVEAASRRAQAGARQEAT